MTATIGFDPEYFVAQPGQRTPVPVCGLLGGTKANPLPLPEEGYFYHEDNVVAELGVPPSDDPYTACEILTNGMRLLDRELKANSLRRMYHPSWEFEPSVLQGAGPQAMEFGCDPDYDAYTGGAKPRGTPPNFGNTRFAGGHIHLGGSFNCPIFVVALMCDLALACHAYVNERNLPRRQWYGKAGTFRYKDYGLEYRTLDSAWTKYEDVRFDTIQRAYAIANWCEVTPAVQIKKVVDGINWVTVRDFINTATVTGSSRPLQVELKKARQMGAPV